MADPLGLVNKRRILILLIIVGVLLGAGIGFIGYVDDSPRKSGVDVSSPTPQQTPPTVSVTPPDDGDDVGETETETETETGTGTETEAGDSPSDETPTESATPAPTPTATPDTPHPSDAVDSSDDGTEGMETSSTADVTETATDGSDGTEIDTTTTDSTTESTTTDGTATQSTDNTESDSTETVQLSATVSDPPDVVTKDGHVDDFGGNLTGTLTWTGSADTAVVVVSTWSPADGWQEAHRVVVDLQNATGSRSLSEVLGTTSLTYAADERAAAFSNPDDDTTVGREGHIAVTAVLFEDDTEVARTSVMDDYQFDVTNVGEVAVTLGESGSGGLDVTDAAPGQNGSHQLRVENVGETNGSVALSVTNLVSTENGLTPPEARVDQDDDGELASVLELRVAVLIDGERRYLVGGPGNWTPLAGLADAETLGSFDLPEGESRTVVVEWRIPVGAGNEIQTDGVRFDLTATLRSDGT